MDLFAENENYGILQIDASNAFNSLNRRVTLHNMQILCPEFATYTFNCYQSPARLFVDGGKEIKSKEGTTQGDPIAMAMYAIGIVPLLQQSLLDTKTDKNLKKIAFADDFTGVGTIPNLRMWYDLIKSHGPNIGYYPEPTKSWLIVKPEHLDHAIREFEGTGVNITIEGKRHLGAIIGSEAHKKTYIRNLVDQWISEIKVLSEIAKSYPHCAYAAFVFGFQHKFTYVMRTVGNISDEMIPLEHEIRNSFLQTILNGYVCNDDERKLFTLPVNQGGLAVQNPVERCVQEYQNSRLTTEQMTLKVKQQIPLYDAAVEETQAEQIRVARANKSQKNVEKLSSIKQKIEDPIKAKNLEAILEKGASSWLCALPIKQYGFHLDKQSFWDSLYIRYNIPLKRLPTNCICGAPFKIDHALSCPKGGFITLRHNELRDFTAEMLSECQKDVSIEPALQELSGEELPPSAVKRVKQSN